MRALQRHETDLAFNNSGAQAICNYVASCYHKFVTIRATI